MKRFLSLLSLAILVSCNDARKDEISRRMISLNDKNISAISSLTNYETHPDTFTLFFMPHKEELTWSSSLFDINDSYEIKLTKIMKNVVALSQTYDDVDKELFPLVFEMTKIDEQRTELNCDFETSEECDALDTKLAEIQVSVADKTTKKSDLLLQIQQSLDADVSKPVNWQEYGGDAKAYEFLIDEANETAEITIPKLGPYENRYTTKDGDIVGVSYKSSLYKKELKLLSFTLIEKGPDNLPTGYVYDFRLERSVFLNKIRFKGDAIKRLNGKDIQRGTCKFELPAKI